MRKTIHQTILGSSIGMLLVLAGASSAEAAFTRAPWIQDATKDSVTIAWEAGVAGGTQKLMYGDGFATAVDGTLVSNRLYKATVTQLPSSSSFAYKVLSGADESPAGNFITAPAAAEPFRFGSTGDNRSDSAAHASVVAATVPFMPDFMINTGDIVDGGDYTEFFDVEAPLLRNSVIFPAPGNHDAAAQYSYGFDRPTHYSFRWSNAFFVSISNDEGYTPGTPQYTWVEEQLQAAKADPGIQWIFAYHHYPVYSSGSHGSTSDVISGLNELYKANGVDVVFNGHDHNYERVELDNIVYLVTGGGGVSTRSMGSPVSGQQFAESARHVVIADVDGGVLRLRAYRTDGSLMDERLIEKGPPTGEPGPGDPPGPDPTPTPGGIPANGMDTIHGGCMCDVSSPMHATLPITSLLISAGLAAFIARRRNHG